MSPRASRDGLSRSGCPGTLNPGDTDVAVASRIPPFCAVVLVSVLLRLQRQFAEERARLAHPIQDRRPDRRSAGDTGGWRLHRALLPAVGTWRRTRGPSRQGAGGTRLKAHRNRGGGYRCVRFPARFAAVAVPGLVLVRPDWGAVRAGKVRHSSRSSATGGAAGGKCT